MNNYAVDTLFQVSSEVGKFLTDKERANLVLAHPVCHDAHSLIATHVWIVKEDINSSEVTQMASSIRRQKPMLTSLKLFIDHPITESVLDELLRIFYDVDVKLFIKETSIAAFANWCDIKAFPSNWVFFVTILWSHIEHHYNESEKATLFESLNKLFKTGHIKCFETTCEVLKHVDSDIYVDILRVWETESAFQINNTIRSSHTEWIFWDNNTSFLIENRAIPTSIVLTYDTYSQTTRNIFTDIKDYKNLLVIKIRHWQPSNMIINSPNIISETLERLPSHPTNTTMILFEVGNIEDPGIVALINHSLPLKNNSRLKCGCLSKRIGIRYFGNKQQRICSLLAYCHLNQHPEFVLVNNYDNLQTPCPCMNKTIEIENFDSCKSLLIHLQQENKLLASCWETLGLPQNTRQKKQ